MLLSKISFSPSFHTILSPALCIHVVMHNDEGWKKRENKQIIKKEKNETKTRMFMEKQKQKTSKYYREETSQKK